MTLEALGWDGFFAGHFAEIGGKGLVPARVTLEHQHIYSVRTASAELLASVAGGMRHRASGPRDFPAVGDWVALRPGGHGHRAVIRAVLPRRSRFSRKVAGETTVEQVVAANVDTVFIVMGLDGDFSVRRVERYLVTAWDGGVAPVVVLNKADVCEDVEGAVREVEAVAPGVPVHAMSTKFDRDLAPIAPYLRSASTIALLGSSGVGKSTIVNRLAGADVQRTADVRASDQKGRHTTSRRQLIELPGGALLIDTPGMRELQLWEGASGITAAFEDIEALAAGCRFGDCRHDTEPGCAVKAAAGEGRLAAGRLASYRVLQREREALAARQDERGLIEKKRQDKILGRAIKAYHSRSRTR
ncbi:MAG TPA: ribosome small subunit-dependent GTPase A [Vicinamibacterales bacterium]|nr:ribosome small subunit-dependent GTPase A [Vicinamibacterales bacterium]HOQ61669.1 ribosome small subunit-dependent GTPase A [Vicinamibacterales bacterium]HPK73110.1 ribosome small subunit-dependent GTPase A [Vicinamibacterales bacterium]